MAVYGIFGSIVDTDTAKNEWEENTTFDGSNHISKATGSQWTHETLYLSSKGRYYIVRTSQWQGSLPEARFVDNEEAAKWLLLNDHELPDDLAPLKNEVCE